jgi:hypothetical protein
MLLISNKHRATMLQRWSCILLYKRLGIYLPLPLEEMFRDPGLDSLLAQNTVSFSTSYLLYLAVEEVEQEPNGDRCIYGMQTSHPSSPIISCEIL